MDQKKNSFLTYVPLMGSVIIFFGVVNLEIYYWNFGLNIVHYLKFTEILTSFLDKIFIIFISALISIVIFIIHFRFRVYKPSGTTTLDKNFKNRLTEYWRFYKSHVAIFILTAILGSLLMRSSKFTSLNVIVIASLIIILPFLIFVLVTETINFIYNKIYAFPEPFLIPTFIIGFILLIAIMDAYIDANAVKVFKVHTGTAVKFRDNTVFTSDSSNYYIGKTEEFLFLYHQETPSVDVIPIEFVQKITFQLK